MDFAKTLRASALTAMAAGALAACSSGEPGVYSLSFDEAKAKLSGATSDYQSGEQIRSMASKSWSNDGYNVRVYNDVSFSMDCRIEFEALSETQTRITPNCGSTPSASGSVPLAFLHSEVEAHVAQILVGKPIDARALMLENTAVAVSKMPQMQGEAVRADFEARVEAVRNQNKSDDWGSNSSSDDFSDDWGN